MILRATSQRKLESGDSSASHLRQPGQYLRDWTAYFGINQYYRPVPELDDWIRRRIRMCYWKQWRWLQVRLRGLGQSEDANPGAAAGAVQRVVENARPGQREGAVVQGPGLHHVRENFVEQADLLNRPLRTRTVGGVGAGG